MTLSTAGVLGRACERRRGRGERWRGKTRQVAVARSRSRGPCAAGQGAETAVAATIRSVCVWLRGVHAPLFPVPASQRASERDTAGRRSRFQVSTIAKPANNFHTAGHPRADGTPSTPATRLAGQLSAHSAMAAHVRSPASAAAGLLRARAPRPSFSWAAANNASQRRLAHRRVPLPYDAEHGLPGFLSPNALRTVAVDWQEGVLARLDELVRGQFRPI